jgi:phage-related protein
MDEFYWLPDWNAQGSNKSDITKVQFGDGYVQRQTKGMNPIKVSWSLTFNPREDTIADDIEEFLRDREGVVAFTWTPPGGEQVKWTCSDWTRNKLGENVNSLSMTFERVYEP